VATDNERAGDRVFANVDKALAEKIISRSMENSRAPERVYADTPVYGGDGYRENGDTVRFRFEPSPALKVGAALLALLVLLALVFRRRDK
jgi:MYXO-CTERM domain-containing protein